MQEANASDERNVPVLTMPSILHLPHIFTCKRPRPCYAIRSRSLSLSDSVITFHLNSFFCCKSINYGLDGWQWQLLCGGSAALHVFHRLFHLWQWETGCAQHNMMMGRKDGVEMRRAEWAEGAEDDVVDAIAKSFVVCKYSRVAWALFICLLLHIIPNVFIYIVR